MNLKLYFENPLANLAISSDDPIDVLKSLVQQTSSNSELRRCFGGILNKLTINPYSHLPNEIQLEYDSKFLLAGEVRIACFYCDIDNLQILERNKGPKSVQALLRNIGMRFNSELSSEDVVYHVKSDEFIVFCEATGNFVGFARALLRSKQLCYLLKMIIEIYQKGVR